MSNKFLVSIDSRDLDWRFIERDWPSILAEVDNSEEKQKQRERLDIILAKLPPRERDIVHMYYILRVDQRDIAQILDITQGDVSYRLKRAIKRIKFLLNFPEVDLRIMRDKLSQIMPSPQYIDILEGIYVTSSQSAVAKNIGLSQGKIRYRFLRCMEILQKNMKDDPILKDYFELFNMISTHHNILRELHHQKRWAYKFQDTCAL